MPEEAVIAVDVGNNTYAFGMYFESKAPACAHVRLSWLDWIFIPGRDGAWAAAPTRKIVAVAGDGGFGQYLAEFTTAVKYKMPITLILLNNSELAKISREQRAGNFHVWQTELHNPNLRTMQRTAAGSEFESRK